MAKSALRGPGPTPTPSRNPNDAPAPPLRGHTGRSSRGGDDDGRAYSHLPIAEQLAIREGPDPAYELELELEAERIYGHMPAREADYAVALELARQLRPY